jgi:hypothetical protein
MTHQDEDLTALWTLKSLHSNAVRGYYTYVYLRKLLRSQEKSIWEELSIPLGIAASVVSIFAIIQSPASFALVLVAYSVAIFVVGVVPIIERRYRRENGLDDEVYLGIYLDEISNYVSEIELARIFRQSEAVKNFVQDRKDALGVTLSYTRSKISKLKASHEYPDCLKRVGRSEEWVKSLSCRVKAVLGCGFIE